MAGVGVHPLPQGGRGGVSLGVGDGDGGLVEQAATTQVLPEPGDRVAREPAIDLLAGAVTAGVVGVGVSFHAVGERLDENRAAASRGRRHRTLYHRVNGGYVVAVHHRRGNSVTDALAGQRGSRGLLGQRDANRVSVVLDEEDYRRLPDGREIQGRVRVALTGRAVAEHDQGDRVLALDHGRAGQSHGVQGIGRQRRALGCHPVLVRVVAAMPVSAQQGQDLDRVHAARGHGHRIAVGRKQPVLRTQSRHRADLACFLAARGWVHRESPLLGQRGRLRVKPAAEHHHPVQGQENVIVGHGEVLAGDSAACGVQQRDRSLARQQPLRCHGDGRHLRSSSGGASGTDHAPY